MWNDVKLLSIRLKKIIIYLKAIIIFVALLYLTFNYIIPSNSKIEIRISAIAVLLTIWGFIVSIANQIISKQLSADIGVSLETTIVDNDAIITCTVENKGLDCINEMVFYLLIDQPTLNTETRLYEYKQVLKHGYDYKRCKNTSYCALSEECMNSSLREYPSYLKKSSKNDLYYGFKKLDFLSNSSVMYINSGERFTEDISFNLEKGVYRAILVGRFNKHKKDCLCANKQFIIKEKS